MAAVATAELDIRSLELLLSLPCGYRALRTRSFVVVAFPGHKQGISLEEEQIGYELVPLWDARTTKQMISLLSHNAKRFP